MKTVDSKAKKKRHEIKVIRKLVMAAVDPYRPLLAQIVVTQRCNLSCGYCFEYDKVSKPVPLDILKDRIDHLKRLKVVFVTLNGGEPLMNPEIVNLVKYIRKQGMIPMMNSNGFLLKPKLIDELNDAGLYGIQMSCDGLEDNDISIKSMKRLEPKLAMLKEHAKFKVRVNTVYGANPPEEAKEVAMIVMSYGFDSQCSLVRDEYGAALPLSKDAQNTYMKIRKMKGRLPRMFHDKYQVPLVQGKEIEWKCRSGARYFHIDTKGLVHLCQPREGNLGKPLEEYTKEDIKRNFHMKKACSKRCPHAYAHIGSRMDGWRSQKTPWNG